MKVIYYEIKKVISLLLLFLLISVIVMSIFWQRDVTRYTIQMYNHYYFWISNVGIIYLISKIYIQDFRYNTIRNLLVISESISKLNVIRILNAVAIGVVFFIGSQFITIVSIYKLNSILSTAQILSSALNMLIIYILISITSASYVNLIAYFIKNYKTSYILSIIPPLMINHFLPLVVILLKKENSFISKLIDITPSKIILDLTTTWTISLQQLSILFVWIILLYILQFLVVKNREF